MSGVPGTRLLRFAERTFDRATVEMVIAPAIADLQHECAASGSGRSSRAVAARSYWAVLKTISLCLLGHVVRDRDHAGRDLIIRLVMVMTGLVALYLIPSASWTMRLGADYGMPLAVRAQLLSMPSTIVLCMPLALLFATSFVRSRPHDHGSSTPAAIAAVAACTAIVAGLLMVAAPHANQAFRRTLSRAYASRTGEPATVPQRGLAELTLPMLNAHIAAAPSAREEARARGHRNARFAFATLVPIAGLLGLGLSGRWRSPAGTIVVSLAAFVVYRGWFELGSDRYGTLSFYWPWVANGLFFLFAVALLRWRPAATNAGLRSSEYP